MASTDFRFNAVIMRGDHAHRVGGRGPRHHACTTTSACPTSSTTATDEQKQRWLPGIASGELITAIAMTEPGAGSDLAGIATTARRDGDDYVVNGAKTFITNGINADLVVTAVKTDPTARHRGIIAAGGRTRHARLRPRPQPGEARPARPGHRRALLHRRARCRSRTCSGEEGRGFRDWSRTCRRSGCRSRSARSPRPTGAGVDARVRQGAQGVRAADRVVPEHPLRAGRAGHRGRHRPALRRRLRRARSTRASSPPRTRPRPSGGAPSCRAGRSTAACSCTAGTAT